MEIVAALYFCCVTSISSPIHTIILNVILNTFVFYIREF